MKKSKHSLLSLVLLLLVICLLGGCGASKDTNKPSIPKYVIDEDDLIYKFSGGEITINGFRGEYDGYVDLVIPSEIDGFPVIAIGDRAFAYTDDIYIHNLTIPDGVVSIGENAFKDCAYLEGVTIPDSVTTIEEDAFYNCKFLGTINIPNSVTYIGDGAFRNCESLTGVTIPDSVTFIGDTAFEYCNSMTGITVSPNNPVYTSVDGVLFSKDKTTLICYPAGRSAKSYHIPNGTKTIEPFAFAECLLFSITVPESITSLDCVFLRCTNLTDVNIPDSVTSFAFSDCFAGCTSLTTLNIPSSVTDLGIYTFDDCNRLSSITIPDGVKEIGPCVFRNCALKSITIPSSVTEIDDDAFENGISSQAIIKVKKNSYAHDWFVDNGFGDKVQFY